MPALWNRSRKLIIIVGAILLLGATVALIFFLVQWSRLYNPAQPAPMNHKLMVGAGIACVYCHNGVYRSPAANIPSVAMCAGCHRTIKSDQPPIEQVMAFWDNQEPIEWVRVYRLPKFVHFTHEVHISQGVNCENCHGDVAEMTTVHQVIRIEMGYCIGCHHKQPNAEQLVNCSTCHW